MEIRSAALIGAGAVGAYFIYNINQKMGDDFFLIAEGARKERLEKEGVLINGERFFNKVKTPKEARGVDLLLIATKYDALKAMTRELQEITGPDTIVLTLLNGIDSEEITEAAIGKGHVIRSFMKIVSARNENGTVFNNETTPGPVFGEDDGTISERVQAVSELFKKMELKHVVSEQIITDQWNKFGINVCNNLLQAVLGVGYAAYHDSENLKRLHGQIVEEFYAVARAEGITITQIPTPRSVAAPGARFSTLQDIDAGRKTEVEMLMGVFLEHARKHGIRTPFCEYTYYAIKTLEEKNEGKFDYQ